MFKLVPEWFPDRVGAVTGVVGAAGGLGGFFPPLVMGVVKSATGGYAPRLRADGARRGGLLLVVLARLGMASPVASPPGGCGHEPLTALRQSPSEKNSVSP